MGQRHDLSRVLQVGELLFRRQGYHHTGVEEILSKTDFPRSSFYYHFKSKEGFGKAALEYYSENILAMMRKCFQDPSEESYLQRLQNYFYMIADYNVSNSFNSCCLIQRMAIEEGSAPGELQEAARKQFGRWFVVTEKCMQQAQDRGEVRADISADRLTRMVFDLVYGESTLSRVDREAENFKSSLDTFFQLIRR
ncbi:TetR/AcrR family transcriptional regulator [Flavilitoribacter nigricans]|uniref:HTH tetR-type domain-containing protein n=1 Tax=Flavilitoribacter nigricans (strain ATCC 23147 / DSM 23189 / NBRC 102662 / NCIMB 1420 / SS-2) TaxID=1122177 RepID=A0A2D0N516_FLAN2|nr:TetR/AcrR family transcriptional regulator [Flavilitoribacter nigricans]PHN03480.1 hypothetical protein CRP01_26110 [Flavilitoribacter nigricans DSM 23189 = NBRC 102662]